MKWLPLFILTLIVPLSASSVRGGEIKRPNIVLIVTDDQGADSLGCYGNPVIKTPNIDRLAEEGVRFDNCYASASSCSPNRSVLLSGLQHYSNGMYGLAHRPHNFHSHANLKTLPRFLAETGYRTACVGKYHLAPESVYPFEHTIKADSNNTVQMAERSRGFIGAKDDHPFFLYFCTAAPHVGGGTFKNLPHQPDQFNNRPKGYPGVKAVEYAPEDVIVPPYLPDIPETRAELAQYYQAVSRADQGVGRLVDILKETGAIENTVIVFLSDNGHAMPAGEGNTLRRRYPPALHRAYAMAGEARNRKSCPDRIYRHRADVARFCSGPVREVCLPGAIVPVHP